MKYIVNKNGKMLQNKEVYFETEEKLSVDPNLLGLDVMNSNSDKLGHG